MNEKNLSDTSCPIARGVAGIGDAWSMLILRDASLGLTRFDQFRKSLGIAPTILTRRLAMLTEEGLLEKSQRSATVTATSTVRVIKIEHWELSRMRKSMPDVVERLQQLVEDRQKS
jgi:DNA-binding HxlR family transcriptional regulator